LRYYVRLNDDSTAFELWQKHEKEYPVLSKMT